jgi:2-dehydropantoate 2-reductase
MRVLIYGGGAVGLGIASCLLKTGQEVTIVARPETVDLLNREGLIRSGIFGAAAAELGSFDAVFSLDQVPTWPFDHILVCTKSFDSEYAAQDIHAHPDLLAEGGCIVLFQNGWGNAEVFTRFFAVETVYNARVITGFMRHAKNQVQVTVHAEAIHVGSLYTRDTARVEPLCEAIAGGDIPCQATPEIGKDLWAKMLFNCPLNALGAVLGVTYGALGESEWTRAIMELIVREIFVVMRAAGYATHWELAEEFLVKFYADLLPRTAEHYSSTLQDLRAGKRTEVDALNGAIVALGKRYGIPVPANAIVYGMVQFLEKAKAAPPRAAVDSAN